jgi:hypothetical protein
MPETAAKPPKRRTAAQKPEVKAKGAATPPKASEAPKKIGRPSKHTPELAAEICQRLSNGEPLRQICRDDHMPSWVSVYSWMSLDATLSERIAQAREAGQDAMAEKAYAEMYDEPERMLTEGGGRIDPGYVQLVKARAEITLKLLAKWNPKRYGDRIAVAGDAESPIKVEAEIKADKLLEALVTNAELRKTAGE